MDNDDEFAELISLFLEECGENIDLLENGLLRISEDSSDIELLNEIFRAAHSIKGGGATFGFANLSQLTHHMETLLDAMRSGTHQIVEDEVDLLLQAVDVLRDLLEANTTDSSADHDQRIPIEKALEAACNPEGTVDEGTADPESDAPKSASAGWLLTFVPKPELMARGNDPLLLLKEVAELGEYKVTPILDGLPAWSDLVPDQCYVSWTIEIRGNVSEADLTEIFEWVEYDCEFSITSLPDEEPTTLEASNNIAAEAEEGTSGSPDDQPATAAAKKEPAASTEPAKAAPKSAAAKSTTAEPSSIRIATDKVDHLINLVGELVITQSMLSRAGDDDMPEDELQERLVQLERNTRELQESVMRVRMLPISSAFGRLPRIVRDLSKRLGKQVSLEVEGESTELDKTVLEHLIDPLVHLVRNSLDHGLESADARREAGKPEVGTIALSAAQQGGSIIIEIRDDGQGINEDRVLKLAQERGVVSPSESLTPEQIQQLIFAPGFSTAAEVSDVSGRGVGLDVVRRNIVDLGGRVEVSSTAGEGTLISIRLPLTLAILDGQLIKVGSQRFVMPTLNIIETIELEQAQVSEVPGQGEVCRFRDQYVKTLRLRDVFEIGGDREQDQLLLVVDVHNEAIGLIITGVLGQQQVVIKNLDENYRVVPGFTGATIMSDGSVALIIDPLSLTNGTTLSHVA